MLSWLSIRQARLSALLSITIACRSQPVPPTITGSPGSAVELSGSASPDSASSDLLPASACGFGDLVFWPDGGARPWPFACAAARISSELKASGPSGQVALSGSLLIPTDQPSGRTVPGEIAGYLTVAYRTSSVIKEILGRREFATRRTRIRYPLKVEVVGGQSPAAPAGLIFLDSLIRQIPLDCVKYLRTSGDDAERFARLALMLLAGPRGLPVPGTGVDCIH